MSVVQIVLLLLGISLALNAALAAGCLAKAGGKSLPASALIAGGAAATMLTVFYTALAAYR